MKKIAVILMAMLMVTVCLFAQAEESDLAYVQGKGKLVVGITDFAPMDFKEEGSEELLPQAREKPVPGSGWRFAETFGLHGFLG